MKKLLLPALIVVFALVLTWMGIASGKRTEREKQEKAQHRKTVDSIATLLAVKQAQRDTIIQRVPVERVRIVHAAARVDTVRLGFQRDTTTADSLDTALVVIATQDTLIQSQAGHIKTLNEIVAADSGIARLFMNRIATDSLRIVQLEKPSGWRIPVLGIRLPRFHCGPGGGGSVYPTITPAVGVYCVL